MRISNSRLRIPLPKLRLVLFAVTPFAACGLADKPTDTASDTAGPPDSAETADSDSGTDSPVVHCAGGGGWAAVSAGFLGTCGIHENGCIECWTPVDTGASAERVPVSGNYRAPSGYLVPPNEEIPYVSVDLAAQTTFGSHTCAIRVDGGIDCWGSDAYHATSPPDGQWTQVSVGEDDGCALAEDGRIACWGIYIGPGEDALYSMADDYFRISNGRGMVCGLGADGRIDCWDTVAPERIYQSFHGPWIAMDNVGEFVFGVTPDGVVREAGGGPHLPQSSNGVVDLCIGGYLSSMCILDTTGAVRCTGFLDGAPDATFTSVSCGWIHACGVTVDAQLLCWGDCRQGDCAVPVHE